MGWIAGAAGVAFAGALVLLAMFFATKDQRLDRVAEWLFVAFAALAIPTMLAVGERLTSEGPHGRSRDRRRDRRRVCSRSR